LRPASSALQPQPHLINYLIKSEARGEERSYLARESGSAAPAARQAPPRWVSAPGFPVSASSIPVVHTGWGCLPLSSDCEVRAHLRNRLSWRLQK
jgi:hypothetical protein